MDKWEKIEDEYWFNAEEELYSFSEIMTKEQFEIKRDMNRSSLDLIGWPDISTSKIRI